MTFLCYLAAGYTSAAIAPPHLSHLTSYAKAEMKKMQSAFDMLFFSFFSFGESRGEEDWQLHRPLMGTWWGQGEESNPFPGQGILWKSLLLWFSEGHETQSGVSVRQAADQTVTSQMTGSRMNEGER